jgi:hypothetical protein
MLVRDGPDAGVMPAVGPRHDVGHDAVMFAVGRLNDRITAEAKIRMFRIAERPAASVWRERADLFRRRQVWIGARRGGLRRRRRLDKCRAKFSH